MCQALSLAFRDKKMDDEPVLFSTDLKDYIFQTTISQHVKKLQFLFSTFSFYSLCTLTSLESFIILCFQQFIFQKQELYFFFFQITHLYQRFWYIQPCWNVKKHCSAPIPHFVVSDSRLFERSEGCSCDHIRSGIHVF